MAHESGARRLRAVNRFPSRSRVSPLRRALSGRQPTARGLLLGSVSVDGFRNTNRESLRDIEVCLHSVQGTLYHPGFRGEVARSTLSDANESHDWRILADFAQVLIGIARPMYAHDQIGVDLDQSLYALDSTTIDLCLPLFPWLKFRQRKWIKQHLSIKAF